MQTAMPPAAGSTSNDTVLAALAHLFGWMSATVVLAVGQRRSAYVRFQALQALVVDLVLTVVGMVVGMVFGLTMGLVLPAVMAATVLLSNAPGSPPPTAPGVFLLMPMMFMVVFPCMAAWGLVPWALRLYAVFRAATGHVYAYPLIGRWLKAPPDAVPPSQP